MCINLIEGPLFQLCKKHHFGIDKPEKLAQSPDESKFLMKTFSQIKSNVAVPIKKKVFFFAIQLLKMYPVILKPTHYFSYVLHF